MPLKMCTLFDIKLTIFSKHKYLMIFRLFCSKKLVSSITDSVMVFLQQTSAFLGDWIYGYNMILNKIAEFFEKLIPEVDALYQKSVDDVSAWLKDLVNQYSQMVNNVVEYIRVNKDNWREIASSAIETFKGRILKLNLKIVNCEFSQVF